MKLYLSLIAYLCLASTSLVAPVLATDIKIVAQAQIVNLQSAKDYYSRGIAYHEQGKDELALADYNKAIEIDPNYVLALVNRGIIYSKQGKDELALADYNKAIENDPNDPLVYNNRAVVYSKQGKEELALADYGRSIEINSNDFRAYNNRGFLYATQGKIELATADLKRAQQLFSEHGNNAAAERVADYLKILTSKSVGSTFNTATETTIHQSAEEYYSRGLAYHKQNEDDLAIAEYTQVIKHDQNNKKALNEKALINRGLLYAKQGKYELALADYNQAIKVNPNNSGSYRNRGVLYFEQGEHELARTDWNKAIKVNPEDAQAYFNRGLLFRKLGDITSAQADLEKAHQLAISQDNDTLAQQIDFVLDKSP